MAADKSNEQRLIDLKAALKAVKPKQTLSLADCAALWGVTKPRFVNKRAEIAGFPDASVVEGNAHFYPARAAIKAMIAHLERHERSKVERVRSQTRLLGGRTAQPDILSSHTLAELAAANRLNTDLDQQEIDQGLRVLSVDVAMEIGEVFSELSEFCTTLSNQLDPHGELAPEIRATIDTKAHEALLRFHAMLKARLTGERVDTRDRRKNRAARSKRIPR